MKSSSSRLGSGAVKYFVPAVLLMTVIPSLSASQPTSNDSIYIPERAVVLNGEASALDKDVLGVFYSREDLAFNDPDAPRFLLVDRKGKIAFGIGGQLYATASYDFDGSINDGSNFTTYDINVPAVPGNKTRFGANLSNSSLFMRLVGKSDKLGMYQVYFQSNFTGGNGGYGFTLKQAYVALGNFTVGLTNSTFVDGASQAPTIDTEGPSGQVADKNILFRYTTPTRKGVKAAFSIELPQTSYTTGTEAEHLSARVPDIPAYVQYSWANGQHVRLSGIFRDMAYRDLHTGQNKYKVGWGAQLSTIANIDPAGILQIFGHVAYGQGIGQYVNDLGGNGFDLVESETAGELIAPKMMGWTAGAYINVTPRLMFTGSFSRAEVFDLGYLGGDTYHYGQYLDVNTFYTIDSNFTVGAEYLRGWRKNYSGESNSANRFNLLLQYSF